MSPKMRYVRGIGGCINTKSFEQAPVRCASSPSSGWTRGLARRRSRLIPLLDDQELQRCVANVSQFMPGNRRNVSVATSTKLDLPRTLFVLQLCLASAYRISDVRWVGVANVHRSRRESAARYADLGVLEEFFARFLALPLDR